MHFRRLALVSAVALAAGVAVAAPASAQPDNCPEGSGAAGRSCVIHVDDLLQGTGLRLGAHINLGDCPDLLAVIVKVQAQEAAEHGTVAADAQAVADLRAAGQVAQDNDTAALKVRDAAIAAANAVYAKWLVDNPKAADAAKADALKTRDAAIAAAVKAYNDGGTAAVLAKAKVDYVAAVHKLNMDRKADQTLLTAIVKLQSRYDRCKTPVSPVETTVVVPPAETIVTPPPVVVSPAPVIVENPQVGVIPSGPPNTGAMTESDRYTG